MYILNTEEIKNAVYRAFADIASSIEDSAYTALCRAKGGNAIESFALDIMQKNALSARQSGCPVCQDTGLCVVFLDIGQELLLTGESLEKAVNDGVRQAYITLRKSVLSPLSRINTGDNTPAVIHTSITDGHCVKVSCLAKGFGSENMSRVFMLTPADGKNGIIKNAVETVVSAGGCPCPPVIVGIGIGGDMEYAAILSKRALLRKVGSINPDAELDALEKEILEKLNQSGVGAQGFGGDVTALAVFIQSYPTHIAGLPLAITVQCHCSRHAECVLEGKKCE